MPNTMNRHHTLPRTILLAALLLATTALAMNLPPGRAIDIPDTRVGEPVETPPAAPQAEHARTLRIPDHHRQLGRPYFVIPPREVQVRITSDAPLERIDATARGVIGYAIAEPPTGSTTEPRLLNAGEFHLPIHTIETGIKLRDQHLRESAWLDATNHSSIIFHLESFKNATIPEPPRNPATQPTTVHGTIVGVLTMRGVSRRIEIDDASLTYLPESEATRRVAPGDLLAIRCRYAIRMADFGIKQSIIGSTVAESIVLDQVLYLSTVLPESEADAKE